MTNNLNVKEMNRLKIERHVQRLETNGFNCTVYIEDPCSKHGNICKISFSYPEVVDFIVNHNGLVRINIDRVNLYGKDPIQIGGLTIKQVFENTLANTELILDLVEGWLNSEVLNQDAVILLERKKKEIADLEAYHSRKMEDLIIEKYENEDLKKRINDMENAAGKLFFKNIVAPAQGQVVYSMPLSQTRCNEPAD